MARALFALLVVTAIGLTGAMTYKWYTGECPFGCCHNDSTSTVKRGCCTSTTESCCTEAESATSECPSAKEAQKDGGCCPEGPCCPDGPCCKKKEKAETTENKDETPK